MTGPAAYSAILGEAVGPCRLLSVLGSGGMGVVYLARVERHTPGLRLGDRVALKVYHPPADAEGPLLERFLREAEAGRRISHPNVVRAYEAGSAEAGGRSLHYILMEFLEGTDIQGLLRELGRFPEHLCRRLGRDIARGLGAIHAAGIVHRDLKPENILVTPDYVVKIADMGIARVPGDWTRISVAGQFLGTFLYGAPEQFDGAPDAVDPRTDLYGLGWVLYLAASGVHPFAGREMPAIIHSQIHLAPPPLESLAPGVTPFYAALVHALLEKNPDRRPSTAEEVVEALEGGEDSAWWAARRPAEGPVPAPPPRRSPVAREAPFVGRGAESALLLARFAEAAEGRGSALLLEGPRGSGRTRLVVEAAASLEEAEVDFRFLRGSHPVQRGGSFAAAVLGALSQAFGPRVLVEGLLRRLPGADGPALAAFLARGGRGELPRAADGPALAEACLDLCRTLAAERPLLLLIEDLHLAPPAGRRLFQDLAAAALSHAILLVGTVPSAQSDLAGIDALAITALGEEEVQRIAAGLLRSDDLAAPLAPYLAILSGGNPLSLVEGIQHLRVRGLVGKSAEEALANFPPDLLALCRARLANLEARDREILDLAACQGFEFDPPLVGAALGMDPITVLRSLAGMEESLRLVRSSGERWRFEHGLVQEVLLAAIPAALQREYEEAVRAAALKGPPTAVPRPPAKTVMAGSAPRKDRVLVVDDDPRLRDILCQLVETIGCTTIAAENGLAAVAALRRDPPDLVITDLLMPGLDGREVLSRVKRDAATRDIPVIVVTGNDDVGEAASCIAGGAEDYVVKPYNMALLAARVKACLERRRLRLHEQEMARRIEEYALELEQAARGSTEADGPGRVLQDLASGPPGAVTVRITRSATGTPEVEIEAPTMDQAEVAALRARLRAALARGMPAGN